MTTRTPVVVLGGIANALSVTRSIGARGVPVHFFGDRWATPRFSRFCTQFVEIEQGTSDRYLEPLERHGPGAGVLIPCGDDALEFVAHNRELLETMGYTPIEANDEALLAMLDKERSYELARQHDVPTPQTVMIRNVEDLREAIATIGLPAALKPRVSHDYAKHFAGKAVVVEDVDHAERTYQMINSKGVDVLLTEIVPGPEGTYWGYYAYLDDDGSPLLEFTKRKLRQYPVGFGLGTLHRMDDNPDVIEVGRRFVQGAGLRGLVNVEFKRDERDGRYVMIECNHRITAANELMVASGIDLGGFVYDRLTGADTSDTHIERTDVALWWPLRDASSAIPLIRAGKLSVSDWRGQLRGRIIFPAFRLSDPMPVVAGGIRSGLSLQRHAKRIAQTLRR